MLSIWLQVSHAQCVEVTHIYIYIYTHMMNIPPTLVYISSITYYFITFVEVCTPPEKRQITMVLACIQVLNTKIARSEVSTDVLGKVEQLTYALGSRNYPAATFIQTVSV